MDSELCISHLKKDTHYNIQCSSWSWRCRKFCSWDLWLHWPYSFLLRSRILGSSWCSSLLQDRGFCIMDLSVYKHWRGLRRILRSIWNRLLKMQSSGSLGLSSLIPPHTFLQRSNSRDSSSCMLQCIGHIVCTKDSQAGTSLHSSNIWWNKRYNRCSQWNPDSWDPWRRPSMSH